MWHLEGLLGKILWMWNFFVHVGDDSGLGYCAAGSVLPKDGDEKFWMPLACSEGLQLRSCVLLKRNLLFGPFWCPSHCVPEQIHLWRATTLLPLICSALVGPVAISELGIGMGSGSTRQCSFSWPQRFIQGWACNPNKLWVPRFCLKL